MRAEYANGPGAAPLYDWISRIFSMLQTKESLSRYPTPREHDKELEELNGKRARAKRHIFFGLLPLSPQTLSSFVDFTLLSNVSIERYR